MFNKKDEKKKASIDFTEKTFDLLTEYKEHRRASSNSLVINYLIDTFISLNPEVKKTLAKFCSEELDKMEKQENLGAFETLEVEKAKSQYLNLIGFFTDGKGIEPEKHISMQRIDIENGYVIAPEDYIVVRNRDPKDCKYVGVIEVRNGAKYSAPHFIFFSQLPLREMTEYDEKNILDYCCAAHYEFRNILNMVIDPVYDSEKNMLNSKEWMEAPQIGFFPMYDYGEHDNYPGGSMVVRTDNTK